MNAGTQGGWTALHFAVRLGHVAIVQAILQVEGVNLNVRTNRGIAPLHWARFDSSNALLVTQALLDAGADPNATDNEGETPLYLAAQLDRIAVVEALLDGGANPAVRNNDLDTALHMACRYGQPDVVQFMIQRCGGPELVCLAARNVHESTPLDSLQIAETLSRKAAASCRKHILQCYGRMLAHRNGLLCVHSVLQDATFTALA